MVNDKGPNAGDYQVRKVKVYLTEETLRKEERWDKLEVLEPLCKDSEFYLSGQHFDVSKYFDNSQIAGWNEELIATDIEDLAKQLYSIGVRETEPLYDLDKTYEVPGDDNHFEYTNLSKSEWQELQHKLNAIHSVKAGRQPEQLEIAVGQASLIPRS